MAHKVGSISALRDYIKRSSGGGPLRHVPEEGIMVRFLEEPDEWVIYKEGYDKERKKFFLADDDQTAGDGERISTRYLANALRIDDDSVIALKLPSTAVQALLARFDRHGTLMDRDYEIAREGKGLETQYLVTPEAPEARKLNKYELLDLEALLLEAMAEPSEEDDKPKRRAVKVDDAAPARRRRSTSSTAAKAETEERPLRRTKPKSVGSPSSTQPTRRRARRR